jgi:hypothetical protein
MVPQVKDSAPPFDTLPIVRLTTSREHQIALIKSRGPNSRGVNLLHAGLADLGKTAPLQPGQPMVNLPLEATKRIRNSDGQFFFLYPKYTRS